MCMLDEHNVKAALGLAARSLAQMCAQRMQILNRSTQNLQHNHKSCPGKLRPAKKTKQNLKRLRFPAAEKQVQLKGLLIQFPRGSFLSAGRSITLPNCATALRTCITRRSAGPSEEGTPLALWQRAASANGSLAAASRQFAIK